MPGRQRAIAMLMTVAMLAGCSAVPVSEATAVPGTDEPSVTAPPATSQEPSAAPTATPDPTPPGPTPTDVPPKPGNPTFTLLTTTPKPGGGATVEHEITWTSPAGLASEFLAYGLTTCLRDEKKYDGKPCVVKGMAIPRTSLELIGRAPGDARSMTVSWDEGELGVTYWSILIRATNSFGNSIFTIVHSENVCFECTY